MAGKRLGRGRVLMKFSSYSYCNSPFAPSQAIIDPIPYSFAVHGVQGWAGRAYCKLQWVGGFVTGREYF